MITANISHAAAAGVYMIDIDVITFNLWCKEQLCIHIWILILYAYRRSLSLYGGMRVLVYGHGHGMGQDTPVHMHQHDVVPVGYCDEVELLDDERESRLDDAGADENIDGDHDGKRFT